MSFSNIKGHTGQVGIIKAGLKQNKTMAGRGYLFSGPEGIGKRLAAETLIKALNCDQGAFDSCDKCPSCLKIDKRQHPDVHFLDDSQTGQIKIEDIRQLKHQITLRPYEAKYKVFILDNSHNLTAEAANALLKTLEEPTANSLIILISSKPELLFKTIVSRCRTLRFYPMQRRTLEQILKEDYGVSDALAHFLSFFCEGRLGTALTLKDKDILSDRDRIINGLVAGESTAGDKQQMRDMLTILSVWFRDIYLVKSGVEYSELINIDRKDELSAAGKVYSYEALDKIFGFISDAMLWLEQNVNSKLISANLRHLLQSKV